MTHVYLSVPEFDVHGVRLILEALDLRADGPQVSLGGREERVYVCVCV